MKKIFLEKYPDAAIDSDVLIVNSNKVADQKDQALEAYRSLPIKIDFKARLGENPQITLTYKKYISKLHSSSNHRDGKKYFSYSRSHKRKLGKI